MEIYKRNVFVNMCVIELIVNLNRVLCFSLMKTRYRGKVKNKNFLGAQLPKQSICPQLMLPRRAFGLVRWLLTVKSSCLCQ